MKDINILVFGDSIVHGIGDLRHGGWVKRLSLCLDKDGNYNYDVFNLGVSGEETEDVLKRFVSECKAIHVENKKTIIIFAIGINDTVIVKGEGIVTSDKFKDNIKSLIAEAKQFTDNILFVGLTKVDETKVVPLLWNKNKSYFNKNIIEFDGYIKEICLENMISYTSTYDLLDAEDLADGLHPNENGYEKIYEKVLSEVIKF